jgi:NADH-quinone oxidoreductase subunit E
MCDVLGGQRVYEALSEQLEVGHDETTSDGTITLEHAECLAACDYGPVMTVNYEFFDRVDPESAVGLVAQLREGRRPQPSRGARLCTLKEMSLQLAGFAYDRPEAMADGVAGDATLQGLRLAQEHGISVEDFDPQTPIAKPRSEPAQPMVSDAHKPASDRKPAGDAPLPQEQKLKEAQ